MKGLKEKQKYCITISKPFDLGYQGEEGSQFKPSGSDY